MWEQNIFSFTWLEPVDRADTPLSTFVPNEEVFLLNETFMIQAQRKSLDRKDIKYMCFIATDQYVI